MKLRRAAIFLDHLANIGGGPGQGLEGGLLAEGGGAEHGVLVDLHHGLDEFGGAAGIAEPEAGHGPGLGEAVQEDRALAQARQAHNAGVGRVVSQFAVNLVGDDDEVALAGEGGDVLEVGPAHNGAGGVVGEIEHQDLGAGGDLGLEHLRG